MNKVTLTLAVGTVLAIGSAALRYIDRNDEKAAKLVASGRSQKRIRKSQEIKREDAASTILSNLNLDIDIDNIDEGTEFLYNPEHWEVTANVQEQNMLNLLYLMAEDQSRRSSHCHRGVTCNACGATPIRGVRFKCAECIDVDLCQYCEAAGTRHDSTHVLLKIRTPIPITISPRWVITSWRPPSSIAASIEHSIPSCLTEQQEYTLAALYDTSIYDIRAKYAKFYCLVDVVRKIEDSVLSAGVSELAFKRQFFASCPSSLVASRVARVYDRNKDGVITFEDFLFLNQLRTLSTSTLANRADLGRYTALQVFELDENGYVHVNYVLRVLKSLVYGMRTMPLSNSQYALTHLGIDEGILATSRPISSGIGPSSSTTSTTTPAPGQLTKNTTFLNAPDPIECIHTHETNDGNVSANVQDIIMKGMEKAVHKAWAGWPPIVKNEPSLFLLDDSHDRSALYMWFYEYHL